MTQVRESGGDRYRFRAVDRDGRVCHGTVVAAGIDGARAKLATMFLMPIELNVRDRRHGFGRQLSASDLATGARILSDLLGSGIPLARALACFNDVAPIAWRAHLPGLVEEVRSGASLSAALARLDGAVPSLMIGLVRAGEMGTGLASALESAATLYEATSAARHALVSALTYPVFLLVACLGSILLRTPMIGTARHAWASAAVCATAGALVDAGVTMPAALKHASQACGDREVASRVEAAQRDIIAGARSSEALRARDALTSIAVRLLRAGEEAGNVAATMKRAAQLERARAMRITQATMKLIEPTLVIFFGAVVAFVAAAMLQALYVIRPGP